MDDELLVEVRRICLGLPDATERETWGHPTFRIGDKIFVSDGHSEDDDGRTVTSKGWIGVVLDGDTDWTEVAELVEDSFRQIAPKRVSARLDDAG